MLQTERLDAPSSPDAPSSRVLRRLVRDALAVPPGAALVSALEELTARRDLSAREWVEVAAAWKRVACLAAAGQHVAVAELDRALNPEMEDAQREDHFASPGRTCSVRRTADEIAPALGMAPRAASRYVALVRRSENLPAAIDALADGRMDPSQLRALDSHTRHLPSGPRRRLEAAAVRWAPRQTRQQLEAALAGEAIRLAPGHASVLVERGVADRDVQLRRSPLAGCSRLVADLPTDQAQASWLALNGVARAGRRSGPARGDHRTLPQLRADTLTALLTGHPVPSGRGAAEGERATPVPTPRELSRHVEVHVVVSAATLAGSDELPASVPGVGPLDPETARRLAGHRPWRRLIADPTTGTLLHVDTRTVPAPTTIAGLSADLSWGPEEDPRWEAVLARLGSWSSPSAPVADGYRPTSGLRRHVQTRDATCIGPACFHPAAGTQLDHTQNYGVVADGSTARSSPDNLGSVCERIHNAKTHGGWRLEQPTPGTFTWTSPTGRTYPRASRPLVHGWGSGDDP